MMTRRKLWVLALLAAAVLAIVGLSAGISALELPMGEPFSLARPAVEMPGMASLSSEEAALISSIIRGALTFIVALLPFSIIYLIISPEARRRLLPNLILLTILIIVAHLIRRNMDPNATLDIAAMGSLAGAPEMPDVAATNEFSGDIPPWLTAFTSLLLAFFVVLLSALIGWSFYRRRRPTAAPVLLDQVAEEAQTALDAIQAGGDLRSTVIRCYQEMNRAVREARGIRRPQAMTAREFEEQLERAGLPGQPVHDLTRLFEEVRYGAKELGPWEERRAVACLTGIVEHVKGAPEVYVPDAPPPDVSRPPSGARSQ